MSRHRYEPVPQRPQDEVIILDSIHSANYNFNSGIPNSVASSQHTPSIIAPSIPSSPPPSFHTHSSPGTPRPTPSTSTGRVSGPSYAELWGVAPSTIGGETEGTMGTSNDALATIAGLKQRVEWLEESIGRLLLEKDTNPDGTPARKNERDNCCVTFTDASPDLERALISGKGSNCCVAFRSSNMEAKRAHNRRHKIVFGFITLFLIMCILLTVILTDKERGLPKALMKDGA